MKLLLDTHAFLWWLTDDERLSPRARRTIADPRNDVFFSVVSAWEIVLKVDSGKLTLPSRPDVLIPEQLSQNRFVPLPIQLSHALGAATLPALHRDPFDRLLVAQALAERLAVVSGDTRIGRYSVRVVW